MVPVLLKNLLKKKVIGLKKFFPQLKIVCLPYQNEMKLQQEKLKEIL